MTKQWKEALKKAKPKIEDIVKVQNYLIDNDLNFYDKMIAQIHTNTNEYVFKAMGEACTSINVFIDKERLKKWIEFCQYLDNIPIELCEDIALRNTMSKMRSYIYNLKEEVKKLKNENKHLKGILGYEKD